MNTEVDLRNEASSSNCNGIGESVITDYGRRRSSCGYCKSGRHSSISHGLWAHSITVADYQELLDRGWRRSGCFLYKPEMRKTCCPSYTIRLKASDFVPSKEHIRVLKRMQRFLDGIFNEKKSDCNKDLLISPTKLEHPEASSSSSKNLKLSPMMCCDYADNLRENHDVNCLSCRIDDAVNAWAKVENFPPGIELPRAVVKVVSPKSKMKLSCASNNLRYTCSIAFPIAALIRKKVSTSHCLSQAAELSKVSADLIAERLLFFLKQQGELVNILVMTCNGHLNFYSTSLDETVAGGDHAAMLPSTRLHGRSENTGKRPNSGVTSVGQPFAKRRKLEVKLKISSFDPEEYALYRRYQIKVHNDSPESVTESSYRRFLVDTPLTFVPPGTCKGIPHCGLGSFHQQYLIDGKLIAVGVVDILPKCLSSKYLFWDPDLPYLSLGKYTALKEIEWVKEVQSISPALQYYYLGYYIHSCNKMRYKAAYAPSELLCPLRYKWVRFSIAKPLLDKKPYVVLSDFLVAEGGTKPECRKVDTAEGACSHQSFDVLMESIEDDSAGHNPDFEEECSTSSEESDTESANVAVNSDLKTVVSNVILELNGFRLRFKDLSSILSHGQRSHIELLEQQLGMYIELVGADIASHIVYLLR